MTHRRVNIKTDFDAKGDGSVDDTAFMAFNSWARDKPSINIHLTVPPGIYNLKTTPALAPFTGIRWLTVEAYGARFSSGPTLGSRLAIIGSNTQSKLIKAPSPGDTSITLLAPSDHTIFRAGDWVYISAFDLQGFGQPPNHHFFEFQQIESVNQNTGVLTLARSSRIRQRGYSENYPVFNAGSGNEPHAGGPAMAYRLHTDWDCHQVYKGAYFHNPGGPMKVQGKYIECIDCVLDDDGTAPTVGKHLRFQNCRFTTISEVDKAIELLEYKDCEIFALEVQSSSIGNMVVENCRFVRDVNGTPRNSTFRNCDIPMIQFGPTSYGTMETCLVDNCRVGSVYPWFHTIENRGSQFSDWTLSKGVLSRSLDATFSRNMTPGSIHNFEGMGLPFKVLDVRKHGSKMEVVTTIDDPPTIPPFKNGLRDAQAYVELPPRGITVINSTGCKEILYLEQGNGRPANTYARQVVTSNGPGSSLGTIGFIEQITVNVIRPYTGLQGTLTVRYRDWAINQSDNTGQYEDFYLVNVKIAGKRIISPLGNSGAQSGDTLLNLSQNRWKVNSGSEGYILSKDISAESPSVWPIVSVEVITNYGEVGKFNWFYGPNYIN